MDSFSELSASSYFRWKSVFDWPLSLFLFILVLPLIAVVVILVRLTSKGPGFYKQVRLGKDGKAFDMYKIRSMRVDAEAATGAVWATRKDNRITFIGRIIRKTKIDELPQLYNVLRGEMALIGPRPERPELVNKLEHRIDGYDYRLLVKPGLSGLAQLNQASDIDLSDVRRKLVYDFEYIEKASLWLDFRIVFGTILKMLFLCNLFSLRLLGLYCDAARSPWASPLKIGHYTTFVDDERLSSIITKRIAL